MNFELPIEQIVRPVPGDPDLLAFRYDFELDGKAVEGAPPLVTELEDGDLIIEGYAAVFDGVDRENENFLPGVFADSISDFLGGQSALCFHHKPDKVLGKVLELNEEEGKGLRMRARVDGAIRKHPELGVIYDQIKRGTINALSVGGFFKRKLTEAGYRISGVDFTEISVTPVPVHPGTSFAVVAGKALTADLTKPENFTGPDIPETEIREEDFWRIEEALAVLDSLIARIERRNKKDETDQTAASE